ncbi:MAG TPA: hypothetical protein VFA15_08950, partial [Nitrososphaera sp.]|nr:hypothetical protein [Nitrososphaera sp.]
NNVKVYLIPNLHAKIYLNEKSVLVSSMNLHRTSIIDSKDFAIAIGNNAEALKFREYVVRLMGKGTRLQSQMSIRNQISRISDKAGKILPGRSLIPRDNGVGFCVRSRHKIGFNPEKPLCPDCYREWSKYENEEYEENYCHSCGNEAETTFSKPLCRPCWKKHN